MNEAEPKPQIGMPPKPRDLGEVASEEWDRLGPSLVALGVLSTADGAAFEAYCTLFERARYLRQRVNANPEPVQIRTSVDGAGNEHVEAKPNPLYAMERDTLKALAPYLGQFGLTPATRSKIVAAPSPQERSASGSWAA